MPKTHLIPGTTLEGGGQLVRLSVCLSALTGEPIRIHDIRGNRPRSGGLKSQHLTAVQWLADACNAATEGVEAKSRTVVFEPGRQAAKPVRWWKPTTLADTPARSVTIDLKSPGAVTLVLQAILPFLLFSGSAVSPTSSQSLSNLQAEPILLTLKGGTNVSFAPSVDYATQVLFPNLALIGLPRVALSPMDKLTRGWTHGRPEIGSATFVIQPLPIGGQLQAFVADKRGAVVRISATVLAHADVRRMIRDAVIAAVLARFPEVEEVEIVVDEDSRHAKRMYLLLVAQSSSGWRLGRDLLWDEKLGRDADALARAVRDLVRRVVDGLAEEVEGGACADEHMLDQLVVFQALAKGRSSVRPGVLASGLSLEASLHAKTMWWLVETLLGVQNDGFGSCEGLGLVAGREYQKRRRDGNSMAMPVKNAAASDRIDNSEDEITHSLAAVNLDSSSAASKIDPHYGSGG